MSEYTQSELPAIELFKKLNYDYLDAKIYLKVNFINISL